MHKIQKIYIRLHILLIPTGDSGLFHFHALMGREQGNVVVREMQEGGA